MRNSFLLLSLLVMSGIANCQEVQQVNDPVEWVNPLMGTDSKFDLSNGNTYPSVALPWGMNFWVPQTGKMGDGWIYTYDAHKIRGFKQSHQPSPWMNDYGQFSLMPMTQHLNVGENARSSWFSHKTETVKPYYYSVYLADYDLTTEITPTDRTAQFRFTFPKSDSSFIVIDALDKGSYIKIIPGQQKIIGYSTKYARGPIPNFKNYFVIYVDKPFELAQTFSDSVLAEGLELTSEHSIAAIGFKTSRGEKVRMRVATSFIGFEQAELNLKNEQGSDDFEQTAQKAKEVWNNTLNRITVSGGSVDETKTFYSCLYRMLFFPNKVYEINDKNEIVHFSPYTGQTEPGYMFAGTGFWDTFRALYPFLNLVYPSVDKAMQEGLINCYKEGGWLPEWSSPGYADIMVGNNSASVVADAWLKGIRGYDINTLYDALIHGANNQGPRATGRRGVEYYNTLGFVPCDVDINESAARTLEYAYDDFSIYQLAKKLGRPAAEQALYKKRSLNYRNLFDSNVGLMRGKNKDGSFQSPFSPFRWGGVFTEGNSWHYTWSVFHDVEGLIHLMGGEKKFVAKLDSVFTLPPDFDVSGYGGIIHEMREMQVANMGQYAHGNQPIQHMIYLYDFAGEPWKTQYWIRETMKKLYKPTPDGYCGDEDNGQTSAWYVFSALGFYPVCPTSGEYVLGTPLFKNVTVRLENGKKIILQAPGNSADKKYIDAITLNGKFYNNNWLSHHTLTDGAVIQFKMTDKPNKVRGTGKASFPYSLSSE